MIACPGRSPRPARPTAWASSWYVRSARARRGGSARCPPTRRPPASPPGRRGPSRRGSSRRGRRAGRRRRRRAPGSAAPLPLDDVAIEAADPQRPGTGRGPRARPAPCRRRGSGSAASRTPGSGSPAATRGRSGGSAASCRPGGTRAGGRSRGSAWTWPQSRHTTTDAVPRRLITRIARSPRRGVEAPPSAPDERVARAARGCPRPAPRACRRRSTVGLGPAARTGQDGRGGSRPSRAWPIGLDRRRRAAEHDRAPPASRPSSSAASRAWNRGVRSLL